MGKNIIKTNDNQTLKITQLKGVGCGLGGNGMVYPQLSNGEYDFDNGTHILDIDNTDWFKSLDTNDEKIVNQYVKDNTDFWVDNKE
jgi:hypothetical protein